MDQLSQLLKRMVAIGASDMFVSSHTPPAYRVDGQLVERHEDKPLPAGATEKMCQLFMLEHQQQRFRDEMEMNLAFNLPGLGRFRVNVFRQRGDVALVFRAIPAEVPDLSSLNLPETLREIVMLPRGLVLIVGPAGSGKSTTLAGMIEHRNATDLSHIITVEDPIEYFFSHKQCVVHQREIGVDTRSYSEALINAMRQSPDVLVLGEIRDRNTLEHALEYADTGHLCLATFHAHSTTQAFERIVNLFDIECREQVMQTLAMNIQAVISQRLLPAREGGRLPAWEMLRNTARSADLIRRGNFIELREVMEKDVANGMQTLDKSLYDLYSSGRIDIETALRYADSVSNMRLKMRLAPTVANGAEARPQ